jgi:hypothetical protein
MMAFLHNIMPNYKMTLSRLSDYEALRFL